MPEKTKLKIVGLIRKDWSNEKIMNKFPEVTKWQLAAYRAHNTMGRYN